MLAVHVDDMSIVGNQPKRENQCEFLMRPSGQMIWEPVHTAVDPSRATERRDTFMISQESNIDKLIKRLNALKYNKTNTHTQSPLEVAPAVKIVLRTVRYRAGSWPGYMLLLTADTHAHTHTFFPPCLC